MRRRWLFVASWLQSAALAQVSPLVVTIGVPICPTNSMPPSLSSVLPTYSTLLSGIPSMPAFTSSMPPSPTSSALTPAPSSGYGQTGAILLSNTVPSLSSAASASPSSSSPTYVSGHNFTSRSGQIYLYDSNTALSGTTIESFPSKMRRRRDLEQGSGALTFMDCVNHCDETSICVALSLIGDSCLLYGMVQGSVMMLGAQAALNEQRFHGFVNQSNDATPSSSIILSSGATSMSSNVIEPSSDAFGTFGSSYSTASSSLVVPTTSQALSSSASWDTDYSTPAISTSHATYFTPSPFSSPAFLSITPASSAVQWSTTSTSLEPQSHSSIVAGMSASAVPIPDTMISSVLALTSSTSRPPESVSSAASSNFTALLGVSSSASEVQSLGDLSSTISLRASSSLLSLTSTSILGSSASQSSNSQSSVSASTSLEFAVSASTSSAQQSATLISMSASSSSTRTLSNVRGTSSTTSSLGKNSTYQSSISVASSSTAIVSSTGSSNFGTSITSTSSTESDSVTSTFYSTFPIVQSSSSLPNPVSSSLSMTTSTSSALPSATPVRNTGKRGLCYTNDSYTLPYSLSGQNSQVSWGYDYFYSRYTGNDTVSNPAITFIPLLFNDAPDLMDAWPTYAQQAIDDGADALLSFNEPDSCYSGSACMTVNQSVAAYLTAMQPFAGKARLGAPAVTNGGPPSSLTWLGQFLGNCTQCTIDFVPLHWYSNVYAFSYLQYYVELAYNQTGLPIWVTEFGIDSSGGSDAQFQAFLEQALPWFDAVPYVERYAYFYDGPGFLINTNGSGLSAQGVIYNSYTAPCEDWDNSEGHC